MINKGELCKKQCPFLVFRFDYLYGLRLTKCKLVQFDEMALSIVDKTIGMENSSGGIPFSSVQKTS